MMLAWGIGLLLPGDTLTLPQYRLLGEIAPEPVWAAWSVCVGGLRLVALYINGSWRRTPLIRSSCSIFGMIWWTLLMVLFLGSRTAGPIGAGMLWFPIFILFEGYSAYRSARDSYHSGALQRWSNR